MRYTLKNCARGWCSNHRPLCATPLEGAEMKKEFQRDFEWQFRYRAGVFEQAGIDASYHEILRETIRDCDYYNPLYPETKDDRIPVPKEKRDELARLDATGIVEPIPVLPPAGPDKKKRQCFERAHLSGIEFKIWDLARAYWESRGECWLSSRNIAKQCKISRDTAKKYLRLLIKQGWLELVKEGRPGKAGSAKEQSSMYRPVQHAEWVQSNGKGKCL